MNEVTQCAGPVSTNARSHQLRWGDREWVYYVSCVRNTVVIDQLCRNIPVASVMGDNVRGVNWRKVRGGDFVLAECRSSTAMPCPPPNERGVVQRVP